MIIRQDFLINYHTISPAKPLDEAIIKANKEVHASSKGVDSLIPIWYVLSYCDTRCALYRMEVFWWASVLQVNRQLLDDDGGVG